MAISVARRTPVAPMSLMYAQEIGKILADPKLAADTGPTACEPIGARGSPGKKSARC